MTPSQPSLHARSHGCASSSDSTRCTGARNFNDRNGATLVEWKRHDVSTIQPEDVEHVVGNCLLAPPRELAVENHVVRVECGDRRAHRRVVLRQTVAREQANVAAGLEREGANSVVLALENPFGPREPLLRERRGHRFDPLGESCHDESVGSDGMVGKIRRG